MGNELSSNFRIIHNDSSSIGSSFVVAENKYGRKEISVQYFWQSWSPNELRLLRSQIREIQVRIEMNAKYRIKLNAACIVTIDEK